MNDAGIPFEKWTALGNDYLILEEESLPWELTGPRVRRICEPHFGIGSDGVLLLSKSEDPEMVARLRIFNPDGSEAELSGNGAREAVMYLRRNGWTDSNSFTIETAAGPVSPTITSDRTCTLDMGRASTASADFPTGSEDGRGEVKSGGRTGPSGTSRSATPSARSRSRGRGGPGQPRPAGARARDRERPAVPQPHQLSFWRADGSNVRARIFERGVGETLSSGTGASGAAVAAFLAGAPSPLTVELDGGELEVEVSDDLDVRLTGWAEPICSGELAPELVRALAEL